MGLLTPQFNFQFGGTQIPVHSFKVKMASHGSLGEIEASSSIAMLASMGIDLPSAGGTELTLTAGYKETTSKRIFGGYFDRSRGSAKANEVTLLGRDWAVDLVDKKQVLAGLNLKNQTIGQIVTQIAKQAGLKPYVTDPGVLAGATYKDDTNLLMHPQPLWSVCKHFADQCGYDLRVLPDKSFYFGPVELDSGSLNVTWFGSPQATTQNALLDFGWDHSPRRNGNFDVHVFSYDPYTNQITGGEATVTTAGVKGAVDDKNAFARKGITKGSVLNHTSSGGIGSNDGSSQNVVLTFHADGLTAEQCTARAKGIAQDIAKRQIIVHAAIVGNPSAIIHQKLSIQAIAPLLGFENQKYTITEIEHSYSMKAGFRTEITACTAGDN